MSDGQWWYYAVEGVEQLAALVAFTKRRQAAIDARQQWCKDHGGIGTMSYGGNETPTAMVVDAAVEKLPMWQLARDQSNVPEGMRAWHPSRRTLKGKRLEHEFQSLKVPGGDDAAQAIDAYVFRLQLDGYGKQVLAQSMCFQVGDGWVLRYPRAAEELGKPAGAAPTFPGCRPLKLSEFHARLEAEEVETAGAA